MLPALLPSSGVPDRKLVARRSSRAAPPELNNQVTFYLDGLIRGEGDD